MDSESEVADKSTKSEAEVAFEILANVGGNLYAVLDPAQEQSILTMLDRQDLRSQTLYGGEMAEELKDFGPILVDLTDQNDFLKQLLKDSYGNSWGIYAVSPAGFSDVRNALRRLLAVDLPDGQRALFRFYDPRVLNDFIAVCSTENRDEIFRNISTLWVEEPNQNSYRAYNSDGSAMMHDLLRSGN